MEGGHFHVAHPKFYPRAALTNIFKRLGKSEHATSGYFTQARKNIRIQVMDDGWRRVACEPIDPPRKNYRCRQDQLLGRVFALYAGYLSICVAVFVFFLSANLATE